MNLHLAIGAVAALIAGILILAMPQLLVVDPARIHRKNEGLLPALI